MPDVIMFGDSFRVPELRHEVPLGIPDPFLYVEKAGRRHIVIGSMEIARLSAAGDFDLHPGEEFGIDELVGSGRTFTEVVQEIAVRAVAALDVPAAIVPAGFPLWLADRLRANGVELTIDQGHFDDRRRAKTEEELAGMRRAQQAAEAGMDAARALLREAEPGAGGVLSLGGEPLTVERVKLAMNAAFVAGGTTADEFIVAPGPQGAVGHDMGSGEIRAGEPIVIDIWPRDNASAVFTDMTRTYVVGDVPEQVAAWHALCKQALDQAIADIRPGASGRAVYDGTCDIFEAAGEQTQRTKAAGETLANGFFHGLGHGVGLEVHEQPDLGRVGSPLQAGDVVTVEPGLYRQGYGGVRLEDIVLVTDSGAENLTHYPYDLAP